MGSNAAKLERLHARTYRLRDFVPGARFGDWEVIAVWALPRRTTRGIVSRWIVQLRCVVCGHTQAARTDNVRLMRNACSWSSGCPSPHRGRPPAALASTS